MFPSLRPSGRADGNNCARYFLPHHQNGGAAFIFHGLRDSLPSDREGAARSDAERERRTRGDWEARARAAEADAARLAGKLHAAQREISSETKEDLFFSANVDIDKWISVVEQRIKSSCHVKMNPFST
ncbi:hypothetical protein ACJJTC_008411 [Scirpophaga incertulas]